MNTRLTHDDRIDAGLEALLDAALAPEAAPAGLADRILAATTPALHARAHRGVPGVLARIGPALLGLAAAVALSLGGALFVSTIQQQVRPSPLAAVPGAGAPRLASIDRGFTLDGPQGTDLDTQITMLALQVELVDSRELWASPGEAMDDAALSAELEAFADPVMLF